MSTIIKSEEQREHERFAARVKALARFEQLRSEVFNATSVLRLLTALNSGERFVQDMLEVGITLSRAHIIDINDGELPTFGDPPSERERAFAWSWGEVEEHGMCTLHRGSGVERDSTIDVRGERVVDAWYLLTTARIESFTLTGSVSLNDDIDDVELR